MKKGWLMIFEEFQLTKRDLDFLVKKENKLKTKCGV